MSEEVEQRARAAGRASVRETDTPGPGEPVNPELTICGSCRHFQQSVRGKHACDLGLVLVDMVTRSACDSFDPFPRVEGETSADLSE